MNGQQVRCLVPLLLPPRVEVPRGHDIRRDAGVVERVDLVVTDQQVAAAGALLQLLELRAQPRVVAEEVVAGLPLPLDQRVPDEQFAGQLPARSAA